MMAEQVQLDTFNLLHYTLRLSIESQLNTLLKEYALQFAKDEMSIGMTPLTEMTIDTGTSDPVSQKPYPIAMKNYQWVKEEIEKLLTAKIFHGSRSSWSAPIIVVPMGDGGKLLVIDYHALDNVTRKFTWPMPKVDDIFSQLMAQSISQLWISELVTITYPWISLQYPKQLSIQLSANMNMAKHHLDLLRLQHIFKN